MDNQVEAAGEEVRQIDEVTVGSWTVPVKVNVGPSVIFGLVQLGGREDTQLLAFAAALGVMWENTGRVRWPLRCQYRRMGRQWTEYGAAVVDGFAAKGIPIAEVFTAGSIVWMRFFRESELWPSAQDVEDQEGN